MVSTGSVKEKTGAPDGTFLPNYSQCSDDTGPNVSPSEIQATQNESQSQTQSSSVEELRPESSQRKDVNTNSTSDFGDTQLHHAAPLHKAAQIGLTV